MLLFHHVKIRGVWINAILICTGLFLCNIARTQYILSSDAEMAEKVYLQLDNKVYTTDQTIWFKAIVTTAGDHRPSRLSGVLYVELIDPSENIIEQKRIKLDQGFGNGFFQLAPIYPYGMYQVRAYTEWDKNFGSRFFFKDYIRVAGPPEAGNLEKNAIQNVTLIEGEKGRRLQLKLDPSAVDSLTRKNFPLYITLDAKKDTILLRKNRSDQYLIDYVIPPESRFVTLGFETEQHIQYAKTIVLDTTYMDLQFFPESGEMIHGLPTLLGIKLLGYDGKGKSIAGTISNSKGQTLASFKTNQLGMGSVWLDRVDSNENYIAKIVSSAGTTSLQTWRLPAVAAKGAVLSVKKMEDKIRLIVHSNFQQNDSMVVRASCRGIIYYDIKGRLKNGSFEYSLPSNVLPEGIINFTLMTGLGDPVAERLYFNERPETRLQIAGSTDKQSYTQREKTQVSLETKDSDGKPLPAHISLMVFNGSQLENEPRQNILSYFLLNSDLKGEIENPGFYFAKKEAGFDDLDALLLTQGWSKYNYNREPVTLQYNPEPYLIVSGNVKGGLSNKKIIKDASLTLATFGKTPYFAKQKTDSLGRFAFPLDDTYEQNTDILIQSNSKSEKQKDYIITIDQKRTPDIVYDHRWTVQKPDSIDQSYINASIAAKKAFDAYIDSVEGKTLQAVVVKSRILSEQQKLVTEKYGEAKTVIDGQAIRDKEAKWSYGLYSVLLFNFPDQVSIVRGGNGNLYARIHNSELTLVVIDGIPVKYYDYQFIPSLPPSEIKSFELIPYAKNFRTLFCEAIPEACSSPNAPIIGNVIAIYSYAGKGLNGIRPTVGLKKTTVPVFSPTREFYTPKYDQLKPEDWKKPDKRTLIHWVPYLQSDSTGRNNLSFYNGDVTGRTQVIVEAISDSGELGYQEFFYDVRKR